MNDFLDPMNPSDDALASALATLPEPPEHHADFWSSLEADLTRADVDRDKEARRTGRTQFLLVAAALVLVAGLIGVLATNRPDPGLTVADDPTLDDPTLDEPPVVEPDVVEPPVTTELPEPGDRPVVNTDGRTLVGVVDGFLVDELFGYDFSLPAGFTVDFPSTYGSYAADPADPAAGSILTENYFADDDGSSRTTEPFGDEVLESTLTVEVPLYESINDSVTLAESTVTAEQFVFDRGVDGQRVTRVIRLDERVIVIDVVSSDSDFFAEAFAGFRIYEGPVGRGDACSTLDLPVPAAPSELNPAQMARFDGIMAALTSCDWDLLGTQLDPNEFTASIAGGDAIELWTRQERYGEQILRTLYDHLAFPVGIDDAGAAQWPRGWSSLDDFDTETLAALLASEYYSEAELPSWDETGFIGYRTAIDAEGNWNFFLVGD